MAIYSRWGSEITIKRMATEDDVRKLDKREPDDHDRERIRLRMFVVATDTPKPDRLYDGKERVHEVAWLKADGAVHEIDEAISVIS